MLRSADLTIGHLEVPHTTHVAASRDDVPAPGYPSVVICRRARAGVGVGDPGRAITSPTWVKSALPIRFVAPTQAGIAYTPALAQC